MENNILRPKENTNINTRSHTHVDDMIQLEISWDSTHYVQNSGVGVIERTPKEISHRRRAQEN